ncbi:hypothetical protein DSM106972_047560 [Dulcicalothrix desertica PCC 7102]|uniref:Uncharacterized protein n=1 Tax=Dulcicalothrix desertica PCC 7102 TaxID=232991 RepID=A0A3S1CL84_9CYAN|nr:aminoglycoside phosphotransferase [Dulcicalothrix desertica]RUT03842.1 hypothetical protein DSM106972_047560 [Dulcicalothrix desertica PCC 7102]TWH43748.1 hypothetical protein CAL7102_07492 [Dulcicalothrix desertica PCC 7102]
MQNFQDCLTIIIVVLFNLATAMIALDLSITLVQLWNRIADTDSCLLEVNNVNTFRHEGINDTMLSPNAPVDCITKTIRDEVDVESLALLIQKLPQKRARTAARRMGISDKVNGKYQKLGILRMKLQEALKSQPQKVKEVIHQIC